VPAFEFVIEGPAVPIRAMVKNPRRYRKWKAAVEAAARLEWPAGQRPTPDPVEVSISNYFTLEPPDPDNIIKPILDALKNLVYVDDRQVYRVTSEKRDLKLGVRTSRPSDVLAKALAAKSEVLHVIVRW
jgi:crossover junction endodeoxyribonuclease RusA